MNLVNRLLNPKAYVTLSTQEWEDLKGKVAAINRSQAVIEFTLDGTILDANDNFLNAMGYRLEEIQGKHHSLFVDAEYKASQEYRLFWEKLGRGEFDAGQYKRIAKNGNKVWIQASYNPIMDSNNRPIKVIKYATDITADIEKNADYQGQLNAISKSQAVIEFTLGGIILNANNNFLNAMGYSLSEVKGQHHSIFVDPDFRKSDEYRRFWEKLGRGEFDAGQYKRIGKNGREIWIQASYNPIFNADNVPVKIVKYATDITAQIHAANALQQTVAEVQAAVSSAMQGDLTKRIAMQGKTGTLESLSQGVNSLLDTLTDIIQQMQATSAEILSGSSEIAQGNADLSTRTEQQAASLEETASSMEELTSTVRTNADSAKQANDLAEQAAAVANDGGVLIQQVVSTMSDINQSAQKIGDIISVIDGIAFQTNILALNAAVEAARAGDQGRGFAVVASEVRTLAQRSAHAAKDIKTLISDSLQKTNNGNQLVAKSGDTMKDIVSAIRRVKDIMSDIAASSKEQSIGIEEISSAVAQMDEMTQQNSALVEQAAAAAESLQSQADQLMSSVSRFQLASGSASNLSHKRRNTR